MLKMLMTVVCTFPLPTLECTHEFPSAVERQSSEGSVASTDESLFSKLSEASEAGSPITDPRESADVLARSIHSKGDIMEDPPAFCSSHSQGDSTEDLPAFLFSASSDRACELKHPHRDHAVLTDPCSRFSSFRRSRFSTHYVRFAAFPRQSEPLLEQTTRGVKWQQPNAKAASSSARVSS